MVTPNANPEVGHGVPPGDLCPGQPLVVARCDDMGQWRYQAATVEACHLDFAVLRFRAGYRECFDWHALMTELGVRIWSN